MIKTSAKKIRGYKRKLKQLERWKEFALNYNSEVDKVIPLTFNLYLRPFYYFKQENPPIKFMKIVFATLAETLIKLNHDKELKKKGLVAHGWFYYPRMMLSKIILDFPEKYKLREQRMGATETDSYPPRILKETVDHCKWRMGEDVNFSTENSSSDNPTWIRHVHGYIWIPILSNSD
jgi:hypothetical protein